jgi:hypothetical protein
VAKEGDKYQVRTLYNFIKNIKPPKEHAEQRRIENYWFKPYEIRRITPPQALAHLDSPLVQAYLYKIYENPDVIKDMKMYLLKLLS